MLRRLMFVVFALIVGSPAHAQHGPAPAGFGKRIHGVPKMSGVWKAWRALDGWGIEDELRIADASGNPINLTHGVMTLITSGKRGW